MLAVMLVELVTLVALARRPLRATVALLLPGALFLLATRAALTGADGRVVALLLALSLPAHLLDLGTRGWLARAARRRPE